MSRQTGAVPTVYGSSALPIGRTLDTGAYAPLRYAHTPDAPGSGTAGHVTVNGYAWPYGWHVRSDDYASSDGIGIVYWTDEAVAALTWHDENTGRMTVRHMFTGAVLATGRPEDGDPIAVAMLTIAQDYVPWSGGA